MPTTSQGIWYPGSSDAVTPLETTFSTMASSIDNILAGNVQIHRVANTSARNALVSQFPPSAANPLFVWRADAPNGRELEYTKNGTTWYYVNTSEDDTGWVTSGLSITMSANFTLGSYTLRRVGNRVTGRIVVTFVGSNLSSDAAGDFANVNIGSLPGGWSPTQYAMPMTMERVGAAISYGWAEVGGTLRLISSSLQSQVVLSNGAQYAIYLDHYVN